MTRTLSFPSESTRSRELAALATAALVALLFAAGVAGAQDGYSYLRTVEGYVTVEAAEDGSSFSGSENQPLIPGDSLVVGSNSRAELALADGAIVRAGDRTALLLDSLAWTPDTGDTSTRLVLRGGELQLVLGRPGSAEGVIEVECGNATVYLESPGEYRISANGYDDSEIVVRDGIAQVQTDRGSAVLRAGEAGLVEGTEWASVDVAPADRLSRLEMWGDELDAEARLAAVPYVAPEMRYRAARMANYGSWIEIDSRWAWRPYVGAGWRPYTDGTWTYTPSGLTWISNEPWGWVPSHYGTWDLVPGYGWVWFSGATYSPASVYWYWGPTHVAWVPAGYYTSFYAPGRYTVPRLGVYGWAGGDWGFFAEWTFCPVRYFGRARYSDYFRSGYDVARNVSYREIPRGVIATDTRGLRRDVWGQPERITARLTAADTRPGAGTLPDVTDFVARRREVRADIADIVRPQQAPNARVSRTAEAGAVRGGVSSSVITPRGRPSLQSAGSGLEPSARSARSRPSVRPESGTAPGRVIINRGTYGRPSVARPGEPGRAAPPTAAPPSGRTIIERPRPQGAPSAVTPGPGASSLRSLPPADDGSVARRIIEQMRSRQLTTPPSPVTGTSTRTTVTPRPVTPSTNRRPPATSSGSRAGSTSSRSSASRSRSSSSPPPKQAPRSSSSRKPPPGR